MRLAGLTKSCFAWQVEFNKAAQSLSDSHFSPEQKKQAQGRLMKVRQRSDASLASNCRKADTRSLCVGRCCGTHALCEYAVHDVQLQPVIVPALFSAFRCTSLAPRPCHSCARQPHPNTSDMMSAMGSLPPTEHSATGQRGADSGAGGDEGTREVGQRRPAAAGVRRQHARALQPGAHRRQAVAGARPPDPCPVFVGAGFGLQAESAKLQDAISAAFYLLLSIHHRAKPPSIANNIVFAGASLMLTAIQAASAALPAQVHTLLKGLEKIAVSADIPMLVAGDFNSTPGSAAHALLVKRSVPSSHPVRGTPCPARHPQPSSS